MNPFEEKLSQFASDEVMFNAVKGIITSYFDLNVQFSKDTPKEHAYDLVLACSQGQTRLKEAFKEFDKYRNRGKSDGSDINPAV